MESKKRKKGSCDQEIGHWHHWNLGYWFAITLDVQISIAAGIATGKSDRQA